MSTDAGKDKDSGGFHHIVPEAGTADQRAQEAGDTGTTTGDAGFPCTPGPVDTASLGARPAPKKSCSPTQLSSIVDGCFAPGNSTAACDAAQTSPDDASCVSCVYTQATSTEWGPILLVTPPGAASNLLVLPPNFGTCVAAADPSPAGQACGLALEKLLECEIAACVTRCYVKDVNDIPGREALFGTIVGGNLEGGCFQAADTTVCSALFDATNTDCTSAVVGGPASLCFELTTADQIDEMFGEYCGGYVPPSDAGAD